MPGCISYLLRIHIMVGCLRIIKMTQLKLCFYTFCFAQVCYIREKAEKGAPDGICCAEGSVRFRTQMSENSRLESIKGVTELKSNKPAKVKSTFEAINFFKKIVKFVP